MGHASDNSACARISEIVHDLMRRRQLSPLPAIDQNLREVGLKSLDLVNMMLAIEEEFGIEIPQHQLTMDNFQSIGAIERLVTEVAT
jgi:acyl carrier protein